MDDPDWRVEITNSASTVTVKTTSDATSISITHLRQYIPYLTFNRY